MLASFASLLRAVIITQINETVELQIAKLQEGNAIQPICTAPLQPSGYEPLVVKEL